VNSSGEFGLAARPRIRRGICAFDDLRQLVLTCSLRQVFDAAITSLKTIKRAVSCDSAPFIRTVRCLTVAKTLSMGSWCANGPSDRRGSRKTSAASLGLDQAIDGLVVFGRVFLGECPSWRPPRWRDPAPARLSRRSLCALGCKGLGKLVEHVRVFVQQHR